MNIAVLALIGAVSAAQVKELTSNWADNQLTCSFNLERIQAGDSGAFANHPKGEMYEDASFPAARTSLYWNDHAGSSVRGTYQGITAWTRPSELEGGQVPKLWGEKSIKPAGINQGSLGDCWALAGMSALAEWPERLAKVITNKEYSPEGIFEFNFWLQGQEIQVSIDDRLPFKERRDISQWSYYPASLVNTKKSSNGAYWGVLMEKAAAKYYGNYEAMEGGNTQEIMYMLTGMPSFSFNTAGADKDIFWAQCQEYDQKDWIMTASNHNPIYGLPGGHAYTLLGAKQLADGTKLLKMRNPWGSEDYIGPWSDSSDQMTEAVRNELGHVKANDGVFYMDMDAFFATFRSMTVATYQDWKQTITHHTWDRTSFDAEWSIENPVDQDVVLMIDMVQERMFPRSGCDESSQAEYIFFQLDGVQENEFSGSSYAYVRPTMGNGSLYFKNLPAGNYTVSQLRGNSASHSGEVPYSFRTLGATQTVNQL